jgi:hypothetical protein
MSPFMVFDGCLDSNPECCRSKRARYQLNPHPPINLLTTHHFGCLTARVADPHHFNTDPDQAFHFNADPDQIFSLCNEEPDPAPHQSDANNADPCGSESETHTGFPAH